MSQQTRLGRAATTVSTDKGVTRVTYHWTDVVKFTARTVTLKSNGWQTLTTKTRMNQASSQFGLGFRVWQKGFAWFVDLPSGKTRRFTDGMTFRR